MRISPQEGEDGLDGPHGIIFGSVLLGAHVTPDGSLAEARGASAGGTVEVEAKDGSEEEDEGSEDTV